jgi:SAM-dependent methyltransferase
MEAHPVWSRVVVRSAELDLDRYDTDKIANRYLERYDPVLERFLDEPVRLLEVGVKGGGSLLLWHDYFPEGLIVGIDRKLPTAFEADERIRVFEGDQADVSFLSDVARETAPQGFDIVIDDASHLAALSRTTFWHLFERHLKPGGVYVIEDWGTGYWDDWPDGGRFRTRSGLASRIRARLVLGSRFARTFVKGVPFRSHDLGMVGLIKQLVDEQGAADLTRGRQSSTPRRSSTFESLLITPSIVFVTKSRVSAASGDRVE